MAASLSGREVTVLFGMSYGLTNEEIAQQLHLSPLTVKSHAQRIFRKLGVSSRSGAVGEGYRAGWLRLDPAPAPCKPVDVRRSSAPW